MHFVHRFDSSKTFIRRQDDTHVCFLRVVLTFNTTRRPKRQIFLSRLHLADETGDSDDSSEYVSSIEVKYTNFESIKDAYKQDIIYNTINSWIRYGWSQTLASNNQSHELKTILNIVLKYINKMVVCEREST